MQDKYGRTIEYMRVSVTDRCNLRCVYCMPPEGVESIPHSEILTFDEIERVCRIGAHLGITRIRLTGGEPLARRNLPELLGRIKKLEGIEQVALTTNGILLSDYINELVSAGMDGVNISIDTLDEKKYRDLTRGGCIEKALQGLEAALSYPQLNVKVNCVPLDDGGGEDWIALAELARDSRTEVRFIEMMPVGLGKKFRGRNMEEILSVLAQAFGRPREYSGRLGSGPAVYVQFPGFQGRIGFISAVSHQFCDSCNRVRLTSTGNLKPCLQYGAGADLRKLMRDGETDDRIEAVMRETIFRKPARHHFADRENMTEEEQQLLEEKEMSKIGG